MPRILEEPPPRRPAYFWWLLANGLALCFAVISWILCLNTFRKPEDPRNYEIMRKLKRLPELKKYSLLEAPTADSYAPTALYKRFMGLDETKLKKVNAELMRNYLLNFKRPLLLNYVEGNYRVEAVRPLTEKDFFEPGFVVRARAMVKMEENGAPTPYPVMIEYLFPTPDRASFSWFKPGDLLAVSKVPNCAAVLHVSKIQLGDEPGLCVTVVPIVYGSYQVGAERSFSLEPPGLCRPGAAFPLFK